MKAKLYNYILRTGKSAVVLLMTVALSSFPIQPARASHAGAERNAALLFDALRDRGWNVRDSFTWGFLQRSDSTVIRTTLHSGNTYKIVAAGCEDAYDVDVAVYDENGNLIDSDHDTSPVAVADITPKWSGTFYIKVTMYNSTPGGAHYIVQYAYR